MRISIENATYDELARIVRNVAMHYDTVHFELHFDKLEGKWKGHLVIRLEDPDLAVNEVRI
jgi:hypothetical protein